MNGLYSNHSAAGKAGRVLDFDVDRLFVENNQSMIFTAFRGSKLSDQETQEQNI